MQVQIQQPACKPEALGSRPAASNEIVSGPQNIMSPDLGQAFAVPMIVTTLRNLGLFAIAVGAALVVLSPRRRALVTRRLAHRRRFVSRRAVDRDALQSQALDAWDNEGGATQGGSGAAVR